MSATLRAKARGYCWRAWPTSRLSSSPEKPICQRMAMASSRVRRRKPEDVDALLPVAVGQGVLVEKGGHRLPLAVGALHVAGSPACSSRSCTRRGAVKPVRRSPPVLQAVQLLPRSRSR